MTYLLWKALHIASVVLFLGNITTGLFWAAQARKTNNLSQLAATFDNISKSDRWFTLPAVGGILISGVAAARLAHLPILGTSWIFWSLVLFSVSGLVFAIWLAPLQRQVSTMARACDSGEQDLHSLDRVYLKWELWGLLALLTPVAAMVIMVLKPDLPGL